MKKETKSLSTLLIFIFCLLNIICITNLAGFVSVFYRFFFASIKEFISKISAAFIQLFIKLLIFIKHIFISAD